MTGRVLDEHAQGVRQGRGTVAADRLGDLLGPVADVECAAHRLGREPHRERPAARLDDARALQQRGQLGGGPAGDDGGEVGLDEDRLDGGRQVRGERRLQRRQGLVIRQRLGVRGTARLLSAVGATGAATESRVLLVEARRRPSGEDPAGLGKRAAAGDPEGLGLGQDRGDRPSGDGAPRALPGQGRPHEGGGGAGPRWEVAQEGEHPGAQSRCPPGLQVRAEGGAQGSVVVAGARQPGGAGAGRPGQGERRPALGEAVGEPAGGLGGGHPGGAVVVEPQEPGGRGDLDDAGGGVCLQVEHVGGAGQGARAHSAGAADRAALAAPLLQEGGHEPDGLLGVEGGLGGDDVGAHRLQVAGLGGGEGPASQAAAAQGEGDLARQDEAGAPLGVAAALQPAAFDERGRPRCGAARAQRAGGRPPGEGLEHLHGGRRDGRLASGVLAQLLQGGWQVLGAQGLGGPGPQAEGVRPEGRLQRGHGPALDDECQPAQVPQRLRDLLSR